MISLTLRPPRLWPSLMASPTADIPHSPTPAAGLGTLASPASSCLTRDFTKPVLALSDGELLLKVRSLDDRAYSTVDLVGPSLIATPVVAQRVGIAGIVEEARSARCGFVAGDEVFGATDTALRRTDDGRVVVRASMMSAKPRRLDFERSASLSIAATCAWQMLFGIGRIDPGETVLVIGAEPLVGALALQLAAAFGVRSTGVVSCNSAQAWRLPGACRMIDSTPGRLDASCRRAAVVIDTVGGSLYRRAARSMPPGAVLVSCVERGSRARAEDPDGPVRFHTARVTTRTLGHVAALIDSAPADIDFGVAMGLSAA